MGASTAQIKQAHTAAWRRRGNRELNDAEKRTRISALLKQGGHQKVAEAMTGPIIIRLAYQGVTRQVLLEDVVPQGVTKEYDVLDDWGKAYKLHAMDGAVRVERFEGKRVLPDYHRYAAEWEVLRSDLEFLSTSAIDYATDQTGQRIMEQEDSDLFELLDGAITDWALTHPQLALSSPNTIQETSNHLTIQSLTEAAAHLNDVRLQGTKVLTRPGAIKDLYLWDITQIGPKFSDDRAESGLSQNVQFAEWEFIPSPIVPENTFYMLPDPKYVGVLSTRYGLERTEDPSGRREFKIREIFDELIGLLVLNGNAPTKIIKA